LHFPRHDAPPAPLIVHGRPSFTIWHNAIRHARRQGRLGHAARELAWPLAGLAILVATGCLIAIAMWIGQMFWPIVNGWMQP
jgi:hypothetical protein